MAAYCCSSHSLRVLGKYVVGRQRPSPGSARVEPIREQESGSVGEAARVDSTQRCAGENPPRRISVERAVTPEVATETAAWTGLSDTEAVDQPDAVSPFTAIMRPNRDADVLFHPGRNRLYSIGEETGEEKARLSRTLPSVSPAKTRGGRTSPEAPEMSRVLVVDDAASNRKMLCRLLRSRCRRLEQAEDGQQAVDKMKEAMLLPSDQQYDLVIMDFVMPVMDGPTATKEIRSLGYRGLIFGLTGNVLDTDKDYFKSRGADFVLTKPFDISSYDQAVAKFKRGHKFGIFHDLFHPHDHRGYDNARRDGGRPVPVEGNGVTAAVDSGVVGGASKSGETEGSNKSEANSAEDSDGCGPSASLLRRLF